MTTKDFFRKIFSGYLWRNLMLMAMCIVGTAILLYLSADLYTRHGETVTVPDICNKKFADAEHLLEDCGLEIVVTDTTWNKHMPPNCVMQQTPAKGAVVKYGRAIYVTINAPEEPKLILPDIIDNSSEREAIARLKLLGFKIGETKYVPGEKSWVYGITCRGRKLRTGDGVPMDAMIVLEVGNGSLNSDANLEMTDPTYEIVGSSHAAEEEVIEDDNAPDPATIGETEEDPFEEVVE